MSHKMDAPWALSNPFAPVYKPIVKTNLQGGEGALLVKLPSNCVLSVIAKSALRLPVWP